MSDISRVIYYPTLACNCRCKHCGEEQRLYEPECDCELIEQRLVESRYFENMILSITGGEPFLKKGFPDMLARVNTGGGYRCFTDVTTNGICTEQIGSFCEQTLEAGGQPERLFFAVSIDGLPEVHNRIRRNPIAFEKAIETVKLLKRKGIPLQINTVIQQENYDSLDKFAAYITEICGETRIAWIPEISQLAGKSGFSYNEEQRKGVLRRIEAQGDLIGRAYLERYGDIRLRDCHAGQKTFVIAPSGKVYACATGFSYKGLKNRERFYIGDLKEQTLDEIYEICQDEDAPFRKTVRACTGCWGICEVGHELNFWGRKIEDFM